MDRRWRYEGEEENIDGFDDVFDHQKINRNSSFDRESVLLNCTTFFKSSQNLIFPIKYVYVDNLLFIVGSRTNVEERMTTSPLI